jgi:hypothetical protein
MFEFIFDTLRSSPFLTSLSGNHPLSAPATGDPQADRDTQEELNAMHVHGLDAPPQWEVRGIGLPGTRAQPIRSQGAATEGQEGKGSFTRAYVC